MSFSTLIILLSVSISSLAHILLKRGVTALQLNSVIVSDDFFILGLEALSSYWILGGVILHFCALIFWLWALKYVEISYAYPFLALGYVIVSTMAWLWFGEDIGPTKVTGMVVIMAGVLIISRSS